MINIIWDRIVLHEGEIFTQIKGKEFIYRVVRDTLIPSTTNVVIRKNDLEKALYFCPLANTMPVQHLRAPSYIFALLTDERVIGDIDFTEYSNLNLFIPLKELFLKSLIDFTKNEFCEIKRDISERFLCVCLRDAFNINISQYPFLYGYYIDNEYNRNDANPELSIVKKMDTKNIVSFFVCSSYSV